MYYLGTIGKRITFISCEDKDVLFKKYTKCDILFKEDSLDKILFWCEDQFFDERETLYAKELFESGEKTIFAITFIYKEIVFLQVLSPKFATDKMVNEIAFAELE